MSNSNNLPRKSLQTSLLRIEVHSQAGPRILGLYLSRNPMNFLAELPDLEEITPYGTYRFLGGHRLWHAPEVFPRTYVPDDDGLTIIQETDHVLSIQGKHEQPTGLQKTITIQPHPHQAKLTLTHRITNLGVWPVQFSAWAITQLPLGGIAYLPHSKSLIDPSGLQPNRNLALWPYTDLNDERIHLNNDYISVHATAKIPPLKIGYLNFLGWMAYYSQNGLFIKRFTPHQNKTYPDFRCNCECYCGNRFIELETLSPLELVQPGEFIEHIEEWEILFLPEKHPNMIDYESLTKIIY